MRYSHLRSRRGVSLVEMAIVVAIIVILAAIGAGMINRTLPRWRTREAAYEFAAAVSHARELAMVESTQYRVAVTTMDLTPGDGTGAGAYLVQRGDSPIDSSTWDTLPLDVDGAVDDSQGLTDIGPGGKDELAGVGIRYAPPTGGDGGGDEGGEVMPTATSEEGEGGPVDGGGDTGGGGGGGGGDGAYIIGFNPSGMSSNPASDFVCDVNGDGVADGYLCVTFDNERALAEGIYESWTVVVSRAGLVRVIAGQNVDVGAPAGTLNTSVTTEGSSGSGYAFGGTGDPTGWGDGGGGGGGGEGGGWEGGGETGGAIPM